MRSCTCSRTATCESSRERLVSVSIRVPSGALSRFISFLKANHHLKSMSSFAIATLGFFVGRYLAKPKPADKKPPASALGAVDCSQFTSFKTCDQSVTGNPCKWWRNTTRGPYSCRNR